MNKNVVILSVLILAILGTIFVTQKNERDARKRQMQLKQIEKANRLAAEAQKAINEARMAEEAVRIATQALWIKNSELVTQAQSLLDNGQYEEAIDIAKNVLSQDVNNLEAKSILETAMTKLKEIARQQTQALTKQNPQNIFKSVDANANTLGQ